MLQTKSFWYFLMVFVIVLYALSLMLGSHLYPVDPYKSWLFFIGMLIVHIIEIPMVSMKIGKGKGVPVSIVVLKTILFGFTWWLPLKKGIIKQ